MTPFDFTYPKGPAKGRTFSIKRVAVHPSFDGDHQVIGYDTRGSSHVLLEGPKDRCLRGLQCLEEAVGDDDTDRSVAAMVAKDIRGINP